VSPARGSLTREHKIAGVISASVARGSSLQLLPPRSIPAAAFVAPQAVSEFIHEWIFRDQCAQLAANRRQKLQLIGLEKGLAGTSPQTRTG
jgi:hypothetical protein